MPRLFHACAVAVAGLARGSVPRCAVTAVDDDSVEIVISGPKSSYMACGFGGTTMDGTYAIVVKADGSVIEDKLGVPFMLGANMEGSELSSSVTVGSVEIEGDTRTAFVARAMAGASPDHHTFAVGDVPILRIAGKSSWPSYPAEVQATSLTLGAAPSRARRLDEHGGSGVHEEVTSTAAPSTNSSTSPSGGPLTIGDVSSANFALSAGSFAVLVATAALMV